jgi:hypothetical protein
VAPDAKIVRNGSQLSGPTAIEINHMDRILFGARQFYQFVDPSKASPKDVYFTFEMFQDEIAKASGLITASSRAKMTPG